MENISFAGTLSQKNDEYNFSSEYAPKIHGVPITYPGLASLLFSSYDTMLDPEEYDFALAGRKLYEESPLPAHWVRFLKSVHKERQLKGVQEPLDLTSGAFLTAIDLPEKLKKKLPPYKFLPGYGLDARDTDTTRNLIDTMITDRSLRKEFKKKLAVQIPDRSTGFIREAEVVKMLETVGLKEGYLLDLGCGTGHRTLEWHQATGLTTIGIDRQYHTQYYSPQWQDSNAKFVRGDLNSLPIASDSIHVAIMEYVISHISDMSLQTITDEVQRVLIPDQGLFIVGPQHAPGYADYRVFRKETQEDATVMAEYSLREVTRDESFGTAVAYYK
jgi:SAM-dependent methyltransferase